MVGAFLSRFAEERLPAAGRRRVAASVCQPYFEWLRDRLRLGRVLALVAVFLSSDHPVDCLLRVFGSLRLAQLGDFVAKLPEVVASARGVGRGDAPTVVAFIENNR